MQNPLFQKSQNAIGKPYENQCQMEEIQSKIGKWPPKALEKHWLEKVFESGFRGIKKPYKTNGKSTFPEVEKCYRGTLYKPRSNGRNLVTNRKIDTKIIEKALAREGLRVAFLRSQKTL